MGLIKVNRGKRPIQEKDKLTKSDKKLDQAIRANARPLGLNGDEIIEPIPLLNIASCEDVTSKGNSWIILGRDRHAGLNSGYMGATATGASSIDLVVGRGSSHRPFGNKFGSPPGKDIMVNPNFFTDAARIYISQMTDVDQNFGLAEGMIGKSKARSTVAIKADGVRIIGRAGVKIVSGRSHAFSGIGPSGELLSGGGTIKQPAPPIELIAGNNDAYLQGVAKGENTLHAFREMGDLIEELYSAVFSLALAQLIYDVSLGISIFEPWRPAAFPAVMMSYISRIILVVWISRTSKKVFDLNYLQPFSDSAIVSKNVFTT